MKRSVLDKLLDFVDAYESEYGNVEGFKILLEKNVEDVSNIKSLKVIRLVEEEVTIKND
jgi:hypothetical protein